MTTGRGWGGRFGRRLAAGGRELVGLVGPVGLVGLVGRAGDRSGSRGGWPLRPPVPGLVSVSAMPPMLAAATRLAWHLNRLGVSAVFPPGCRASKTLTITTGVRIMSFRMSSPGHRQAVVCASFNLDRNEGTP
jgi:hypothetical protein